MSDEDNAFTSRRSCWAATVSECDGKLTREHYFTRGLSPSKVLFVSGLNGDDEPQRLSIDALAARCLCRKHNNDFSPVDKAAIDVSNALREFERLADVRHHLRYPSFPSIEYRVSGRALERWAFKMTCNIAFLQRDALGTWKPPEHLVRYALGLETPPEGVGLALLADVDDAFELKYEQGFAFLRPNPSGRILGSILKLRELVFVCTWECRAQELLPLRLPHAWAAIAGGRNVLFHPNKWKHAERVAVCFDWGTSFRPDRTLLKLRTKYPTVPR